MASCARSALVVKEGQTSPDPEAGSLGDIPSARDPDVGQDFVKQSIRRPLGYVFIPPKAFRDWFGSKVEAYNPTADDDVADSNWFTQRNGPKRMTPEEVARGPIDGTEPDTSGAWMVIGAKVGGITPGFRIQDAAGVEYLIKFDPPRKSRVNDSRRGDNPTSISRGGIQYARKLRYRIRSRAGPSRRIPDVRGRVWP